MSWLSLYCTTKSGGIHLFLIYIFIIWGLKEYIKYASFLTEIFIWNPNVPIEYVKYSY